jgi:hypothetical protein
VTFVVRSFLQARLGVEGLYSNLAFSFLGSLTRGETPEFRQHGYRPKLTSAVRRPVQQEAIPGNYTALTTYRIYGCAVTSPEIMR